MISKFSIKEEHETMLSFPEGSLLYLFTLCAKSVYTINSDKICIQKSNYTLLISVQFSHSVTAVSDSLRPHESQHARTPCPSPTAGVYPNPCPLSQWCHPTILSSVVPFSCPQSFQASGSFQMSQLFASGGQSIGASASMSVLPMNTQASSV